MRLINTKVCCSQIDLRSKTCEVNYNATATYIVCRRSYQGSIVDQIGNTPGGGLSALFPGI